MGKRKRNTALKIKKKNKTKFYSYIKNVRISPRKIRNLINLIKGKKVLTAIEILKNYISYKKSKILINLILSTISNYKIKTGKKDIKNLYIYSLIVNSSGIIKRVKYAPQGRINEIRKRLSIIKLEIKNKNGTKIKSNI
ncbi:large ribosomal subunit protein uL22 [Candidatus Shikimatogenerans bostrichidophilus]|uniref:large ribosomal subunit protein uL22 n=1 Tax=Candidatus Shikimatogenerans bostrichidophilus TaxID=2943807 RepID=UPI002966BCEB